MFMDTYYCICIVYMSYAQQSYMYTAVYYILYAQQSYMYTHTYSMYILYIQYENTIHMYTIHNSCITPVQYVYMHFIYYI